MSPLPLHLLPDTAVVDADGALSIGGCDVSSLVDELGTPLFVYDEQHLRDRCRQAVEAFGPGRAIYATKAFLCRAMARLAHDHGMLLDVASGGEMHVARSAGVPADACLLHGNNKSVDELASAMTDGVRRIVVDSFDELDRIDRLHAGGLPAPDVLLRVTPGVQAHTHRYIATGQDDSKFGFNLRNGDAERAAGRLRRSASVRLVGLHCHIGSNVFAAESFARAVEAMAELTVGLDLPELVVGGGLGVAYVEGETAPTIDAWARAVLGACRAAGIRADVSTEPGRAIVGTAAVTVYRVGTVKRIPDVRTYVAVDGGMSDNPRPVLYGSGYEAFSPTAVRDARAGRARVVGKHCESGDVLLFDAQVPDSLVVGDLLAVPVTGAYGHSMGSNYNKVPRPAVVFVSDGAARLVVRRETFDDLLATDVG